LWLPVEYNAEKCSCACVARPIALNCVSSRWNASRRSVDLCPSGCSSRGGGSLLSSVATSQTATNA
jgi:hypothetical protein